MGGDRGERLRIRTVSQSIKRRLAVVSGAVIAVAAISALFGLVEVWTVHRNLQDSDTILNVVRMQARVEYVQEELRVAVHRSARIGQLRQDQKDAFLKAADTYGNEIRQLSKSNASVGLLPETLRQKASAFESQMATYVRDASDLVRRGFEERADLTGAIDAFEKLRIDIRPLRQSLSRELADYHTEINKNARSSNSLFGAFGAVFLILIMGCSVLLVLQIKRGVVDPLDRLTRSLAAKDTAASDERDAASVLADRRDEIGVLAAAVVEFKNLSNQQLVLEKETTAHREVELKKIETSISELRSAVVGSLAQSDEAASRFRGAAETLGVSANKAEQWARRAEAEFGAASNETVAAANSITEMAQSVGSIGEQVGRAVTVVSRAGDFARSARVEVEGLSEAAHAIGQVIALIQQIASQTNLLALNATIEAARAGAVGQGFSVVASEVKVLANQSAKAAKEIENRIGDIQKSTVRTVEGIKQIASSFEEIEAVANEISAAVDQQRVSTSDIHEAVQNTASRVVRVSDDISGVTKTVSETSGAISEMSRVADVLTAQSAAVRASIETFLRRVAA